MRARPLRKVHGTEALDRVRRIRRDMTPAGTLLWRHLRGRRSAGVKFRRQTWIGLYIADFPCAEAMLIVEADGGQHGEQAGYDADRAAELARVGWRVLRSWNGDVLNDIDAVLAVIADALRAPCPSPLPRGEG